MTNALGRLDNLNIHITTGIYMKMPENMRVSRVGVGGGRRGLLSVCTCIQASKQLANEPVATNQRLI
jgi:hypothetical protein